jgi:hypothetical protein
MSYRTFTLEDVIEQKIFMKDGVAYKAIAFCEHPTIILENIKTGEQEHHVVHCLNIQAFKPLGPCRDCGGTGKTHYWGRPDDEMQCQFCKGVGEILNSEDLRDYFKLRKLLRG